MQKKLKLPLLFGTLLILLGMGFIQPSPVQAVEFDEDGVIASEEIIEDDLFIAHETVEINGTVMGDVFAAGGAVQVNGEIEGSLFTAAQTVIISGEVGGSVYSGASSFSLKEGASVGRNLYYGGFNLKLEHGSQIGKDLLVGAYQALLFGRVDQDVQAGVGALEIEGSIGGDVFAEVGSPEDNQGTMFFGGPPGVETIVPAGIRVAEGAEIGGTLTYKSAQEQATAIKAISTDRVEYIYQPEPVEDEKIRDVGAAALIGSWLIQRLRLFITLLVLGVIVIWQAPKQLEQVGGTVEDQFGPSLGWGLATIILVYASAGILAGLVIALGIFFGIITLGGLAKTIFAVGFSSLGLALALFGLIVSYLSKLAVSFTAGKLLLDRISPDRAKTLAWPLLLGILIYVILRAIPILGFWIAVLVTLLGVGAMWILFRETQLPAE